MIYAETTSGIRGLLPYRSTYRMRAFADGRNALDSQRCYRFKERAESAEVWQRLIDTAADDLGCVAVWAVPGHDPDKLNALQVLCGTTIRRTRKVERRKYNKAGPVDLSALKFPKRPKGGGQVLIVDDVATTGATLRAICDHLKTKKIKAVPLACGVNWRLIKPDCDLAALSAQWESVAAAVRGPARDKNEQRRDRRKAAALIERRPVEDPARRERLEADPAAWLQWYLQPTFPLKFGAVHLDMIRAATRSVETGAGMCVAAPRGTGKSAVLWGMVLFFILSGRCRFPVVAGWSHPAARRMLRKWIAELADNERLQADYPDACAPFQVSTHANRLKGMAWMETNDPCGADVQQQAGMLALPDSIGALGAISISGNTRGLSIALADGSTARPDLLLLDDPQDTKTAASPALVRKVIERVESDLFNLSGPTSRLSVMIACTIIQEDDVATYFLDHPDFHAVKVPQVVSWPNGWDSDKSPVRDMWETWNRLRIAGLKKNDGGKAARAYYRKHKAELTKGMRVSWSARFDKKRKDPDALYAAMYDYFRLGEKSFMAERQNLPLKSETQNVFEVPRETVARRVNGLDAGKAPADAVHLVGMCDLNKDGARWALAACTNTRALHVCAYGCYPGKGRLLMDDREADGVSLMRGLTGLDELLRSFTVTKLDDGAMPVDLMLVDCGGTWAQAVFDWLNGPARLSPIPWVASRGWTSRTYRPGRNAIGKPGDNWHLSEWPGKGRVVIHNSDAWRHHQQRGWMLPMNAPDSIQFYGTDRTRHDDFADGVTAERLVDYVETERGPLYRWHIVPGLRNDFGDVATGLFVAASRLGLTPTGHRPTGPTRKRYTNADLAPVRRRAF